MPRRRPGTLLALEVGILTVCADSGTQRTHGFAIAKALTDRGDTRALTATGTLYRALHRLAEAGLIEGSWEDPNIASDEGRPRRRLYRITSAGAGALATAGAVTPARVRDLQVRPEPTW